VCVTCKTLASYASWGNKYSQKIPKISIDNSAVKNKNIQKSGNFWSYKFSVGQKRNNETCVFLGFSIVYLKWESKQ
jgi:hypothetical protein